MAEAAKKKAYSIASCYKVEGGKITQRPSPSPKKGAGYFMANHKNRMTCGSTGYVEVKTKDKPADDKKSE